uniref:DNA topoisomerase (ATP-hydrolyzing) n=1 Tax=Paulinella micropora TaxID=1928728 RepID=A0A385I096_9EUKA|nr:DNA gyrase subunit A [Paulinella micropora]AXY63346.1 DNA gyrase subunit A [Paulinella micropora]
MAEERIQSIGLHNELQRSYLEYAMSVIVGRALPDVRDGLKPVQRRILYAMHELGLTPRYSYRKSARIVGDVLGKYHPHGDQAVYDALVRLAQDFTSRYPLLDGHGNFGSVDDDPPAAMRYTEIRLALIASDGLLDEINQNTVDFIPNFDGSQEEPIVLPAQLPFLLLNGCSGIAVGMTTSIPPHNLGEVVDALIAMVRKPKLSDEVLLDFIPGPDFPTGGEIFIGKGVKDTYLHGRGIIKMGGVAHIEELQSAKYRNRRCAVVITELPYQLSKASWIEKLADQINDDKITGITDIRDESDRDGMRLVIELGRSTEPKEILNILQRRTSLQTNFSAIILALVNGQPVQLSLRKLLEHFLSYREVTVIRRTQNTLEHVDKRLEVVEGLIKALCDLPRVISIIQSLKNIDNTQLNLQAHLNLTSIQADAILNMPLRRLTNFEKNTLLQESTLLRQERRDLYLLLRERESLLKSITNELKSLKKRFATPRRTVLRDENIYPNNYLTTKVEQQQVVEDPLLNSQLLISQDGQVRISTIQSIKKLRLEDSVEIGHHPSPLQLLLTVNSCPNLLAFSSTGRVGLLRWEMVREQPHSIANFLPHSLREGQVIQIVPLPSYTKPNLSLGLLSSDGHFKRLPLEVFRDLSGRATTVFKLKQGVNLLRVIACLENQELILASSMGRLLRFKLQKGILPLVKRTAKGTLLLKLLPGESIAGATCIEDQSSLILATAKGQIKRLSCSSLKVTERGHLGQIGLPFRKKGDTLVDLQSTSSGIVSGQLSSGRSFRLRISDYDIESTLGFGQQMQLARGERIKRLIPLIRNSNSK